MFESVLFGCLGEAIETVFEATLVLRLGQFCASLRIRFSTLPNEAIAKIELVPPYLAAFVNSHEPLPVTKPCPTRAKLASQKFD
jgi:hypothetical protein